MMNLFLKYKSQFKIYFINKQLAKNKPAIRENIILFSEPRSGSTWVMNLLQQIPETAVIWEPEHPDYGVLDPKLGFNSDIQYIPKDAQWKAAKEEYSKILSGQKLSKWSIEQSPFRDWLKARQLIVKFVRATALMPWLLKEFKFKHKPIFLIRHPMAVVYSQIRAFFEDEPFEKFSLPQQPYQDFIDQHKAFLQTLTTKLEVRLAFWCLNNKVILQEPKDHFIRIHYEDILLEPESTLKRLFEQLQIPVPESIFQQLNKPSVTDFKKDLKKDPKAQIEKWTKAFSEEDKKKAQRVLDHFGIKVYSATDPYPKRLALV